MDGLRSVRSVPAGRSERRHPGSDEPGARGFDSQGLSRSYRIR